MTINERIKYFRKSILGFNQRRFASELGMAQTGISYIEQPGNNVSDSSIKTICTMYNLNENWLRHGIEPMYTQSESFSLDDFISEHNGTDLEKEIIKTYFELDPQIRSTIIEHFKRKFSDVTFDEPRNLYDDVPATPEELERLYPPVNLPKKDAG